MFYMNRYLTTVLVSMICSQQLWSNSILDYEKDKSTVKNIYHKGWIDFNKNGVKDIYEDSCAPLEVRVQNLLSQMTLEEKSCQMATLYGSGRVLNDALPSDNWKNEVWKDGIGNIDEEHNVIAAPWMVTLWPTDTWSPISMVDFSYKVCSTLPSWMFTPFPMRMELTSPRSTVLNQMLQSRPIFTSPMIVALSAKKQFSPISGVKPLTDFISAIFFSVGYRLIINGLHASFSHSFSSLSKSGDSFSYTTRWYSFSHSISSAVSNSLMIPFRQIGQSVMVSNFR